MESRLYNLIKQNNINGEYDDLMTNSHLILLGLGGSYAYGTNKEGSDLDVRGIAFRDAQDILLGYDFETHTDSRTDTVIYSLDKYISLASNCNPNCIELLGLRDEDYARVSDIGRELIASKDMFLSKKCIGTFGGYANQQLYRLQQKTLSALTKEEYNEHIAKVISGMEDHLSSKYGKCNIKVFTDKEELKVKISEHDTMPIGDFYDYMNEIANVVKEYNNSSKRNNKAIEHGKINKHAMHLLRLYMMAIDLLSKKEIITYRADEHDLLMDIRYGKYSDEDGNPNKEFFDILNEYETKFEEAKKYTTLPDAPDYGRINEFRARANLHIISEFEKGNQISSLDEILM